MQLVAFRVGTDKLRKMGITETGGHAHPHAGHHIDTPTSSTDIDSSMEKGKDSDLEWSDAQEDSPLIAQILGVATLEFGVIFHVGLAWQRRRRCRWT